MNLDSFVNNDVNGNALHDVDETVVSVKCNRCASGFAVSARKSCESCRKKYKTKNSMRPKKTSVDKAVPVKTILFNKPSSLKDLLDWIEAAHDSTCVDWNVRRTRFGTMFHICVEIMSMLIIVYFLLIDI